MKFVCVCQIAVVAAASIVLGASVSLAQVNVPFQVTSGSGTLAQLPSPTQPVQGHDITSGAALFNSQALNYTGTGNVGALGPVDPLTGQVPFHSDTPFLFDFGSGDTLLMHYGHPELGAPSTGVATITPQPSGLVDLTWLATFNPVAGSGTGRFADVVGGAFLMTATQQAVDPAGANLPYRWSSDVGYLTLVPEPGTSLLLALGSLAIPLIRRAQRR